MPNQSITKIEELFSEHELGKPVIDVDYWKLPHGNKFVMLHTAYEKLAIKANVIFTQTNWLCAGADGMFVCEVSGYLRKDAENVQWSVGEANSVNYPAPTKGRSYYPACIAEKRGKDRVIGKLLQLSQLGIMSEMEDQAFANPEKDEQIAELQQQVEDLIGSGITRSYHDIRRGPEKQQTTVATTGDKPVEKQSSEPEKVSSNGNTPAKSYPSDIPKENWGLLDKIGEARVALKSEGNVVRNTAILLFEDKFDSDFSPKDIAKFASSDLESLLKEMQKMVAEQERD